jgi:hypothetical protein
VLRSLIDHIELHPRRSQGQSVDAVLYGDLAEILAFALPRNARKNSPEQPFQGVNCRWLRGLEATYTEHESITNEKPENRSKSRARSHLYRTRLQYEREG